MKCLSCKDNDVITTKDNDETISNTNSNFNNSKIDKKSNHVTFMVYYRRDVEEYFFHFNNKIENLYCFASLAYPLVITNGCVISVFNFNFKFTINDEDSSLKVDYGLEGGKLISK